MDGAYRSAITGIDTVILLPTPPGSTHFASAYLQAPLHVSAVPTSTISAISTYPIKINGLPQRRTKTYLVELSM